MTRKTILSIVVAAVSMTAAASYPEGYYNRMDGKRKETLKTAAKQCVQSHKRLDYSDLPEYWQYSDVYPDLVDGMKRWWDMYSDALYLIRPGQTGRQSFSSNKMQREHAVPKSWWKKAGSVEYTPAYSDMWNLYPSDGAANQAKLNYPFGETRTTTFDNGVTKVGAPKAGYGGGNSHVFEPADEYKGDFARAIFYMATVYDDLQWVYDYMFVSNTYPTLVPWAANMLLQWARQDPVSQKEIDRNNYVEQYQGNRNPFVDFPNLAEYIWGIRQDETFIISEQENTGTTPPITGDPEITAPVNGESLDFGQTAVGHAVNRALQITGHNMTSPLSLRVVGTDKSCFIPEVSSIPATTMNQNGGYLLNITYLPPATGNHEAKLTLYDGGIEGSIVVALHGEALAVPEMTTLHALPASDVTETGYTARWEAPAGIADYYTVTRVRYRDGNEEAERYETGETSYRFDDRDAGVAESYTVTYSRLGIESPSSNSIYVAASGINDMRVSPPYRVYGVAGGITVSRADGEGGMLRIYDIGGNLLVEEEDPADGAFYMLSPGVYIVTAGGGRPLKLTVR
ncbi:MAG: endonuclease [Muribaculaceae bacterium]|nr:endonuclease [Muribaculaceae bacterium]